MTMVLTKDDLGAIKTIVDENTEMRKALQAV